MRSSGLYTFSNNVFYLDSIGICYFRQYSETEQLKVPGEAGLSSCVSSW